MKEQKVIITESQYEIENLIKEGWRVISVTAGHIATGSSFTSHGKFCFVLER
jgi:hypothetical protein